MVCLVATVQLVQRDHPVRLENLARSVQMEKMAHQVPQEDIFLGRRIILEVCESSFELRPYHAKFYYFRMHPVPSWTTW